jgi:hypothetical protein
MTEREAAAKWLYHYAPPKLPALPPRWRDLTDDQRGDYLADADTLLAYLDRETSQ